jgi:hypothetical protein
MMEAARTFETLVNFYQTTRRYNPEDSHLRTHCRENLKSFFIKYASWSRGIGIMTSAVHLRHFLFCTLEILIA